MGKLTISMAIFNSYVSLPEGTQLITGMPLTKKNQCLAAPSKQRQRLGS